MRRQWRQRLRAEFPPQPHLLHLLWEFGQKGSQGSRDTPLSPQSLSSSRDCQLRPQRSSQTCCCSRMLSIASLMAATMGPGTLTNAVADTLTRDTGLKVKTRRVPTMRPTRKRRRGPLPNPPGAKQLACQGICEYLYIFHII